jgi:hypothetical protein
MGPSVRSGLASAQSADWSPRIYQSPCHEYHKLIGHPLHQGRKLEQLGGQRATAQLGEPVRVLVEKAGEALKVVHGKRHG